MRVRATIDEQDSDNNHYRYLEIRIFMSMDSVGEKTWKRKRTNIKHQTSIRILLTVKQMTQKYPGFTEMVLRNLICKTKQIVMRRNMNPGSGVYEAIARIGGKVIIDEAKFMQWMDRQKGQGSAR